MSGAWAPVGKTPRSKSPLFCSGCSRFLGRFEFREKSAVDHLLGSDKFLEPRGAQWSQREKHE